jgi:hypothetical protein
MGRAKPVVAIRRASADGRFGVTAMHIEVESDADDTGIKKPKRIRLNGRVVAIVEAIDRWPGGDYCYFKVRGDDGNLYILRLNEARDSWELTMFHRQDIS